MALSLPSAVPAFAALVVLPVAMSSAAATVVGDLPVSTDVERTTGHIPLAFERNQGQTDRTVKFVSQGAGYQVFLMPNETVLKLERRSGPADPKEGTVPHIDSSVLRMRFAGANAHPQITPAEPLAFKTNYFIGDESSQFVTGVSNYGRIKYKALYRGVDLVFYGNEGRLEYDLVIAPHARADQIRFNLAGARRVSVGSNGDLVAETGAGDLVLRKPSAYQELAGIRKPVPVEYRIRDNGQIAFAVASYDSSKELVIDPVVTYSSRVWGTVTGVAVDSAGNSYVAGYTTFKDLPSSTGYQTSQAGYQDAYVVKLDPTGKKVLYATYLGARRAYTYGNSVAVDTNGNAYIVGRTDSASYPVTSGAYQTTFSTGASFVTKLNATGTALSFSTFVNGATATAIALDSSGNAYLTGTATALATTASAYQKTGGGPFVAKLAAAGNAMSYATYLGSGTAKGVAVDSSGNAYIAGVTSASNFPTLNPVQATLKGGQDAFVSKLNATGSALVYSTYLGGTSDDIANAIAVTSEGEAVVVGKTGSGDFPTTPQVLQQYKGYAGYAVTNGFVVRLNAAGNGFVYSTFLGGDWCSSCTQAPYDQDAATAVAVDAAGFAYVGGYAGSPRFPQPDGVAPYPTTYLDSPWAAPFLARISPKGDRLIYSAVVGERAQDTKLNAVAVDASGNAYAVGYESGMYPITAGAQAATSTAFLFKLTPGKYPTKIILWTVDTTTKMVMIYADVLSPTPGGTVTFMDGGTSICTASVVNGRATSGATLSAGVHKLTAVYSADGLVSLPIYTAVNSN